MIALAISVSSCSDYLQEMNPNEVATDNYFTTLDESESVLTSTYAVMRNHFVLNISAEACRSDMGYPGWNRPSPTGDNVIWYNKTFTNSNPYVNKKWDACYQGIFRANQVIEGLERMKGTVNEATWTQQMAQARFFRGLFHFYLHSDFNEGKIIIRDMNPKSESDFNKTVSTSDEVIEFFRKDLKYAYTNLPAQWENTSINKGRVTAGTAATILGTSFLYQASDANIASYDSAKYYFKDVITNPAYGYELVEDMNLLFTTAGEFNKESIFEINYSLTQKQEISQWDENAMSNRLQRTAPGEKGGGREFIPNGWLAYEYQNEPLDTKDSRNWVSDPDGTVRLRNVSLRSSAMVALVPDIDTEYYKIGNVPQSCAFSNSEFAYFKKYTNHDIVDNESNNIVSNSWKSGKNVVVNRLGDVYLMYAECLTKTGQIDDAINAINAVRKRWGLRLIGPDKGTTNDYDGVTYDQTTLMERLMNIEKPLETSVEGHSIRWIDMRRWGILKKRFDEISATKYYLDDFKYKTLTGAEATRTKSKITFGVKPSTSTSIDIIDCEQASQNYNPSLHDYLPLPLGEILTNPNVNK